jgi:hypothetical protein
MALVVLVAVAWTWPIGLGGRMPVGGDVTRFSIGLMAELGRAYHELRLPLWNPRWGFGFPGLAESQMGVYYPPHVLLYGWLGTEAAYSASFVLHTVFAGVGAFWASRRFGASARSSVLAGAAWALCGSFLIHQTHQWGYTVGSWMPWAWGLAWPLARGAGTRREALLLAAVLTLQVLPGHFQLAFLTQVSVLGLALWGLVERPSGARRACLGALGVVGAVGSVALLGALQLLPTAELARLASSDRDFEYLSGFAATPVHLVSLVAPGLFHRSPLWRPVAWDPFHTSPEEVMPYVGLVPLFLAFGALRRGWRADAAVRALGWLVAGSLLLSFGPYMPGFRWLIEVPGFSFFRAPARWAFVTQLALALLAAKGLDLIVAGTWDRVGRRLVRFGVLVVVWIAVAVSGFELALYGTSSREMNAPAKAIEWTREHLVPWPGDRKLPAIMASARRPPGDGLVISQLLGQGIDPGRSRLDRDRWGIYPRELGPTAGVVASLLVLAVVARRRPVAMATSLMVVALADLLVLGWIDRPVRTAPIRPLAEQSKVLEALARLGPDARALAELGNLPMAAGVAALPAYRTLDRPALEETLSLALRMRGVADGNEEEPRDNDAFTTSLRDAGIDARVFGPLNRIGTTTDRAERPKAWAGGSVTEIIDPVLAAWDHGPRFSRTSSGKDARYAFWRPGEPTARAWFVPSTSPDSTRLLTGPLSPSPTRRDWFALGSRSPSPEVIEVPVNAEAPGWVILSVLDDPEWRGEWVDERGARPAALNRVFAGQGEAGWVGVSTSGPTHATLRLTYSGVAAYRGLTISGVAWLAWALAYWRTGRGPRSSRDLGEVKGEAA